MDCMKLFKKIKAYRLATILNIPASTVYSWKIGGVPKWRISAIIEACAKQGIDISDCVEA